MLYTIFVITTLIVVMHSIMLPVVNELYSTEPRPKITTKTENKTLIYLALALITIITAPIMFFVWLFPNQTSKFKTELLADLKKS